MAKTLPNKVLLATLVVAAFCLSACEARTRQKTLLDVTDRLYLLDQDDMTVIDQVELRQFPYVMAYSKNVTIEG